MRIPETRDLIVSEVDSPATCREVKDVIGGVCLESPVGSEEELSEVLDRCGECEFESADELYDAVVGNVNAGYIGRKKHDDRDSSWSSATVHHVPNGL